MNMCKMATSRLLSAFTLCLAITSPMASQAQSSDMVTLLSLFSALDTDADGTLSTADLISAQQSRFFAADISGDGYVEASELSAYWASEPTTSHSPDRAGVFILSEDQTGDGRLDMIEFINPARQNNLLLKMESDGQPGVSLSEFRIFLQK